MIVAGIPVVGIMPVHQKSPGDARAREIKAGISRTPAKPESGVVVHRVLVGVGPLALDPLL